MGIPALYFTRCSFFPVIPVVCRLLPYTSTSQNLKQQICPLLPFRNSLEKEEMERKVLVICVLVGFLGLLSAALDFAAEATRNKLSEDGTCTEQRTPAFGLGLISGLALVMAQIIINSAACCMFCKKRQLTSRCDRTKAMTCFLGSWVTFVIGFVSLFIGVALNEGHWVEEECYLVRPMVFMRAAVLSLASIILGIFYFIIISSAKNMDPGAGGAHQNQDIALARPQFTP